MIEVRRDQWGERSIDPRFIYFIELHIAGSVKFDDGTKEAYLAVHLGAPGWRDQLQMFYDTVDEARDLMAKLLAAKEAA